MSEGGCGAAASRRTTSIFSAISDYLVEDDTLVWSDIYEPDHATLADLAQELGLNSWAGRSTRSVRWCTVCSRTICSPTMIRGVDCSAKTFRLRKDLVKLRRVVLPMRDMVTTVFETNLSPVSIRVGGFVTSTASSFRLCWCSIGCFKRRDWL